MGTIGLSMGFSAKSYGRIMGSNERVNFGVVGLNGRGGALVSGVTAYEGAAVTHLCDVDSAVLQRANDRFSRRSGTKAVEVADFRKLLEIKDIDAIAIATPDHWHATMTVMGVQAGKHVYVEKPCSQSPQEGEILIEAQKKYPNLRIQMGSQQRSAPTTIEAIGDIANGMIGKVTYAKTWYNNNRGSIGKGKVVPVPATLDWDLWQGPAPRTAFKDNFVHYNWHWFWRWGTGEACNNATHELDIARWALGVEYPTKVSSVGGRFHFTDDDWEFYDTQVVSYEFEGGKSIVWEGTSCNGFKDNQRGRGILIHGTEGSIMLDRNKYLAYDRAGKQTKEVKEVAESATTNTLGEGALDVYHFRNFINGITKSEVLRADIETGHKSVLMCHLANIAQKTGETLITDPKNGHILNSKAGQKMWSREYEKGWELKA